MTPFRLVDSHVHFWDPDRLEYPWLAGAGPLRRRFLPTDHAEAARCAPVAKLVFVEGNPRPDLGLEEARFAVELGAGDPRIAGVVAYVELLDPRVRDAALEALSDMPLIRGIRHNIQGNPSGFCLQREFVRGVREAGRLGLSFDLCVTQDQMPDALRLAALCSDTSLVLDHCGKPAVRPGGLDPWRDHIASLARMEHVWCKLSGLLTEAEPGCTDDALLLPYADHVLRCFGAERVMFGSDWPVVNLAGSFAGWYDFTRRFTGSWSPEERHAFYHDNAERFYRI